MKKSLFEVSKMDCPSEEQMIRMALGRYRSINLQFDLTKRQLTIVHDQSTDQIAKDLEKLNLGSRFIKEEDAAGTILPTDRDESQILKILLLINFAMFVLEIGIGFYAQSTGLIADSFDMLADALVYGMSLYAVGRSALTQHRAARMSGWLQLLLAIGAFSEVARRSVFGSEPNSSLMMGISILALAANVSCLLLLMKHRQGAVHMRASWIFSTNDVLANIGVIIAGGLVFLTKSSVPDLVIGIIIACVVTRGALAILKMSSPHEAIDD